VGRSAKALKNTLGLGLNGRFHSEPIPVSNFPLSNLKMAAKLNKLNFFNLARGEELPFSPVKINGCINTTQLVRPLIINAVNQCCAFPWESHHGKETTE
jgi:hypothetical protein